MFRQVIYMCSFQNFGQNQIAQNKIAQTAKIRPFRSHSYASIVKIYSATNSMARF
jgi:hypothetical protein